MFNSLKKLYSRQEPVREKDAYNQDIDSYREADSTEMYISLLTQDNLNQNDMRIIQSTHIGLSFDDSVNVGDLIDDKYIVTYANREGREKIYYMKDRESDGSFCR